MEFPELGAHCNLKECNRLDFLPVKCAGCANLFCSSHFPASAHSCAGGCANDSRVPVCPLCDRPVPPAKKSDAPDVAVSRHIDADCAESKRRRIFDKRCAVKKCKKKEMIPLECADCGANFCLAHRHPRDHDCKKDGDAKRREKASNAAKARQMAEDEAMARALQASMQSSATTRQARTLTQEELDRMVALQLSQQPQYQQSENGSGNGNGNKSCSVS